MVGPGLLISVRAWAPWARVMVVALVVGLIALIAGAPAPARAQPTNAIKPFFYGVALIAGRPADDGVFVDVLVVHGPNDYTVCGRGEVARSPLFDMGPDFGGPGRYITPIEPTPACISPDTRYTLFVNEVYVDSRPNPGFTPAGGQSRWDARVPEAALRTNAVHEGNLDDASIPIVYFFGTVRDGRGQPANGASVRVVSADGACSGVGQASDLYWQPAATPDRPVGERAFYLVAVQAGGACADQLVRYNFYVNGMLVDNRRVSNPPYGVATRHDLRLPSR